MAVFTPRTEIAQDHVLELLVDLGEGSTGSHQQLFGSALAEP